MYHEASAPLQTQFQGMIRYLMRDKKEEEIPLSLEEQIDISMAQKGQR